MSIDEPITTTSCSNNETKKATRATVTKIKKVHEDPSQRYFTVDISNSPNRKLAEKPVLKSRLDETTKKVTKSLSIKTSSAIEQKRTVSPRRQLPKKRTVVESKSTSSEENAFILKQQKPYVRRKVKTTEPETVPQTDPKTNVQAEIKSTIKQTIGKRTASSQMSTKRKQEVVVKSSTSKTINVTKVERRTFGYMQSTVSRNQKIGKPTVMSESIIRSSESRSRTPEIKHKINETIKSNSAAPSDHTTRLRTISSSSARSTTPDTIQRKQLKSTSSHSESTDITIKLHQGVRVTRTNTPDSDANKTTVTTKTTQSIDKSKIPVNKPLGSKLPETKEIKFSYKEASRKIPQKTTVLSRTKTTTMSTTRASTSTRGEQKVARDVIQSEKKSKNLNVSVNSETKIDINTKQKFETTSRQNISSAKKSTIIMSKELKGSRNKSLIPLKPEKSTTAKHKAMPKQTDKDSAPKQSTIEKPEIIKKSKASPTPRAIRPERVVNSDNEIVYRCKSAMHYATKDYSMSIEDQPASLPSSPNRLLRTKQQNSTKLLTSEVFTRTIDSSRSIEVIFRRPETANGEPIQRRFNEIDISFIETTDSSLSDSIALPSSPSEHHDTEFYSKRKHSISPSSPQSIIRSIQLKQPDNMVQRNETQLTEQLVKQCGEEQINQTKQSVQSTSVQAHSLTKERGIHDKLSDVVTATTSGSLHDSIVVLENCLSPILDFKAVSPTRHKHKFDYQVVSVKGKYFYLLIHFHLY